MSKNAYDTLKERGFIQQESDPGLSAYLAENQVAVYCGFDPTAPGLHLGHMVPIMALLHMRRAGHRVIGLVGGATGQVGDPSGKDKERDLLSLELLEANVVAIHRQIRGMLEKIDGPEIIMANNADWMAKFSFLEFLREVGKHFSVNAMINKESVRRRLEAREQGISFTEFTYQLIQAYDFYHLAKTHGCTLQIGGSDQWGNMTAGIDLTRRLLKVQCYALTFPLITTSTGQKFGKSEGNAVWIDPQMTRPYDYYQYWVQTPDEDVVRFLQLYTLMPINEIEELKRELLTSPEERQAQHRLASEATLLAMGEEGLASARAATKILFGSEAIEDIDDATLASVFCDAPSTQLQRSNLEAGLPILDVLVSAALVPSRGEGRRRIQAGGVYLNNRRVVDATISLTGNDLASNSFMVLRLGKKNYHLLRFD